MSRRSALVCSTVLTLLCGADAVPQEKAPSTRCEAIYRGWRPVLGMDPRRSGTSAKPARGKAFADPRFGTCVARATDHAADRVPGFARIDYSRRQSFNADDTRFLVSAQDGGWHLYDARALAPVGKLEGVGGDAEPQWHPVNPRLLYYLPAFGIGMQIREIDILTMKSRVVADLADRVRATWPKAAAAWTRSEGSPSADARYWTLMVDDKDWSGLGMFTYDLTADKILATYDFAKHKRDRPDHVSMSPTGTYALASWDDGTYAFTRDLTRSTKIHHKSEHSDLALDARGDDVYVSIDYEATGGPVFFTNLRTNVRTPLFPTYLDHTATAVHFSGKAYARPGWVLASTYGEGGGPWQWLHGKVFAIELKANPRIVNLAHHHVAHAEYFSEPHATVNRDFTQALFNSNWERPSKTDIDAYLLELPVTALPKVR